MLLYSLPSLFENFRRAIESQNRLPTAEDLKVKSLEEIETRKNGGELITALAAKNGKPKKRLKREKINEKGIENSKSIKCYDYGIVAGHKRPDCLNKKEDKASEKTRQSANAIDNSYAICHIASAIVPIEEAFGSACGTITRPGFLTVDALLIFVVTQKVFKECTN